MVVSYCVLYLVFTISHQKTCTGVLFTMAGKPRPQGGEEDRTALLELTSKIQENASMMKQMEGQQRQLEMEIRRAAYTAAHLNELPEDATTYRSLGKSYLFQPRNKILEDLEANVKEQDADIKKCKASKEQLSKTQAGLLKELQELQK